VIARPAFLLLVLAPIARGDGLPESPPEQLGIDGSRLVRIDDTVNAAIGRKAFPGAVVLVGRHGKIAFARAYGQRAVEPTAEPMTRATIFDLASLTKPVATATAAMLLIEQGKLRLDDTLALRLPEFDNHGKGSITVEQLLRHRAGLIADSPLADFTAGPAMAWERLAQLDLASRPGQRFVYSDVGFMLLGKLVEQVADRPLDAFAADVIFRPLGMSDTFFAREWPAERLGRIAPTESVEGKMLRGVVHDPRARALGGVAGHAGLFGTADDLALFAQTLLNGGTAPNGHRLIHASTVRQMVEAGDTPVGERRGLGWDIATSYSSPRGTLFGPTSFGHTGFTGTSIWIDSETDSFVILLTNRVHPDGKIPAPTALRADLGTIVASAIRDAPVIHPVECGVDVLIKRGFSGLAGKRIGLVTNHTGRARDGRSTIDVLRHAPGVTLVALFSPEHGIKGAVDRDVDDSRDQATGMPIFSLYGKTQKPSPESLAGIDVLVYDIQDAGVRFYTYSATLGHVLEAAAAAKIPVIVLDRPNPIGGVAVAGPIRDADLASFVAYHAVPVRHGLTLGELARLFNGEQSLGADLTVVPCTGWRRRDFYDRTGLDWVNPSPNLRSLTEALLYPGVALIEFTNVATGRGTDTPFERVGAPWIEPTEFARALAELRLPGVRFVPIRFTPTERQYSGQACGGVFIAITDWDNFDPLDLGVGLAVVLRARYRDQWEAPGLLRLLAHRASYEAILAGKDVATIRTTWEQELAEFRKVRAKYLLYP
jgi:uncharacterized protein YbbC (DUF1343 family)/CubicO group peptidase (beta-lactamase class C family)